MYQPYLDIVSRLGEPLWWDEVGCPRYEPFQGDLCNNVYAIESALILVRCPACEAEFEVAVSVNRLNMLVYGTPTIEQQILDKSLDYGDAPYHTAYSDQSMCAGATMKCDPVKVLAFYRGDEADHQYDERSLE